jgi:hypothetical protein
VARGKGMDGFNPQALHELFLARSKRKNFSWEALLSQTVLDHQWNRVLQPEVPQTGVPFLASAFPLSLVSAKSLLTAC